MTPNELRARCKEVVELAKTLYGIDMSQVQIGWCKGRCAGLAGAKRLRDPVMSNYYVKFNHDMMGRESTNHIDEDTVPHEYAHILGYINPDRFGSNHDYLWARTCRELGGSGDRTHNEAVVYGKGITYEYITDRGTKVRLSDKRHLAVQRGETLRYRKGMGNVTNACAYSIVGMQGRTLAEPVVRKVAGTTVVPPVQAPVVIKPLQHIPTPVVTPVQRVQPPVAPTFAIGQSKAATSRAIMLSGYRSGQKYEQIIAVMMLVNGYDRQLARATFKANAPKVGIPATFC
jgi:predicted SprT family Zn-dependent metalloprotease